jgi:hypothetical protein
VARSRWRGGGSVLAALGSCAGGMDLVDAPYLARELLT